MEDTLERSWLESADARRIDAELEQEDVDENAFDSDSDSEGDSEEDITVDKAEIDQVADDNMLGHDVLESALHTPCQRALDLLPGERTAENTRVTSSSGTNATLIPAELPYVLQAYRSPEVYFRIHKFWERAKGTPGLAEILWFRDDLQIIAVEKVEPLSAVPGADWLSNIDEIHEQVSRTIRALGDKSLAHGDTRMDNIGWSNTKSRYLLYDYDSAKTDATPEQVSADVLALGTSIEYHVDLILT